MSVGEALMVADDRVVVPELKEAGSAAGAGAGAGAGDAMEDDEDPENPITLMLDLDKVTCSLSVLSVLSVCP